MTEKLTKFRDDNPIWYEITTKVVQDSFRGSELKTLGRSKVDQAFHLLGSIKWVPGFPGYLAVKADCLFAVALHPWDSWTLSIKAPQSLFRTFFLIALKIIYSNFRTKGLIHHRNTTTFQVFPFDFAFDIYHFGENYWGYSEKTNVKRMECECKQFCLKRNLVIFSLL